MRCEAVQCGNSVVDGDELASRNGGEVRFLAEVGVELQAEDS